MVILSIAQAEIYVFPVRATAILVGNVKFLFYLDNYTGAPSDIIFIFYYHIKVNCYLDSHEIS